MQAEIEIFAATLAGLTELANTLRDAPIPEEDWAMAANVLRSIEIELAKKRREIEGLASVVAEQTRQTNPNARKLVYESDQGDLREKIKRTRSYNSSGIMAMVMNAGDQSLGEAIQTLVAANALALTWKINGLEAVADRLNLDYRTAHHEIADGDPDFLVGVVTTSKMERA